MAASFTIQTLEDGPRNAIILVNGNNGASTADPGTGGADLAYTQLILPSQLGYIDITRGQKAASLRVDLLEWDVQAEAGYRVDLFWDATVPLEFYHCIGRANKFFKQFGGLYQAPGLAGSTGGIGISTTNAAVTYQAWTITLTLVKNGLNPA
jgi:hypothetical protein